MIFGDVDCLRCCYMRTFLNHFDVFRLFKLEFVRLLEGAFVLFCSIEFAREVDAVSFVREAEELCGALNYHLEEET